MDSSEQTCWTLIGAAARGDASDREEFARRYLDPVRAYFNARWQGAVYQQLVDDAVQDVFVECFREDGPLNRIDQANVGSFRAYLFGIVRNIARRVEERHATDKNRLNDQIDLDRVAADDTTLSKIFDRAWAQSIMRQARDRQKELAEKSGDGARRRVELLRLRFEEGMPIRQIAELWQEDAEQLHRQYSKARKEFRESLIEVVAFHQQGTDAEIEREAAALLQILN